MNKKLRLLIIRTFQMRLVQLYWAWRRLSAARPLFRIALALFLSIICTVGFTLAGGFSSRIQIGSEASGSAVLLDGGDCGIVGYYDTLAGQVAYLKLYSNWVAESSNYAQQCYSEDSSGLAECNYYVSPRLPGYINSTADCPFDSSMCKNASSNILLDTGYLNSHDDFGVNAPPSERILMRSVLHCAPIVTDGFSSVGENYTAYNYGQTTQQLRLGYPGNFTYEAPNMDRQYAVKTDHDLENYVYRIG